jgi:hypothetical protein
MRSDPILKSDTSNVVLVIGDSVVNGGNLSDQDSLATTILEKQISAKLHKRVRVLNISAAEWGPDNAIAYLKHYGTFHAKLLCLVWSSHDSHDNMDFKKVVGVNPQYPDKQVHLAWEKIIEKGWGLIPQKEEPDKEMKDDLGIDKGSVFNTGFKGFKDLGDSLHIPVFLYFHAETGEIEQRKVSPDGQEVINFANQNHVPYTAEFLNKEINQSYYRDFIHYNDKGQKFLAKQLYPVIMAHIN